MNNLENFMEKRGIKKAVGDAFIAYCRFQYSQQYDLHKSGDTIKTLLAKMTEEQVNQAWKEFINDLSRVLPQQ